MIKFDGRLLALLVIIGGFGLAQIAKYMYNNYKMSQENERLKDGKLYFDDVNKLFKSGGIK